MLCLQRRILTALSSKLANLNWIALFSGGPISHLEPMPKHKSSRQSKPVPDKHPDWLLLDPTSQPKPPAATRSDRLPFLELSWADFERLARRLAAARGQVEEAWAYGTAGQAQYGIDILVRLADGAFEVWQTKRYQKLTAADITKAVDLFLHHPWADRARSFVLATACPMGITAVVEKIEEFRTRLATKNIAFKTLDDTRLTAELKRFPDIVDDFFDRPWVKRICSPEAVQSLENRFSRFDAATLRVRLRDCYRSWSATIDPGLLIAGQDHHGQIHPAISISDRFVQPDIFIAPLHSQRAPPREPQTPTDARLSADVTTHGEQSSLRLKFSNFQSIRTSLDQFLAAEPQAVISGHAGAGKSALLRFLALDILSDAPVLEAVRARYQQHIPIWIPFALWARMAKEQATPPSLPDAVRGFLNAQGEAALVPDVLRALESGRAIYLVDGLDEASDARTAETLAALLTSYVSSRNAPAIITSRPQGLEIIGRLAAAWKRVQLAPLSDPQQRALARIWYRILHAREASHGATATKIEARAENSTDQFLRALHKAADIHRLSQTPLFLLAFMELARHGHLLPRSRFAASREIIAQLIEHQPHKRETGALTVASTPLDTKLRDRLLADLAFALHSGEIEGAVTDSATEDDALARAIALIRERQSLPDPEKAQSGARAILQFSEERAGLLVKKAPGNIGFFHLSLQEHLAARHLQQRSLERRIEFVRNHAGSTRWREPILNLLFLTDSEHDAGQLLNAIAQAATPEPAMARARDDLLAEASFSNFAYDPHDVRPVAEHHFAEIESVAYGRRLRTLLSHVVDGLSSESVAALCHAKLAEWTPALHNYARAEVIKAMPRWNPELWPAGVDALFRNLKCENDYVARTAAEALPLLTQTPAATKARLLSLLHSADDMTSISACLYALGCGWHADEDVGGIALSARGASAPSLVYDAIRIRTRRGEADKEDFEHFFSLAYRTHRFKAKELIPDLVQHFAETHRETFIDLLRPLARDTNNRFRDIKAVVGSLLYCDPNEPALADALMDILREDFSWREIFGQHELPTDRIVWTPDLQALVERHIALSDDKFREYEFYWLSKSIKLPSLKAYFLRNLTGDRHTSFWCADALVEGWNAEDPEIQAAFQGLLDAAPERLAMAARVVPKVIADKAACRTALLRALAGPNDRADLVLDGLRALGIDRDDEEAFRAALDCQSSLRAPLYRNLWRASMIQAFPWRNEVRNLALQQINRRDGEIAAIANAYPDDPEICSKLLKALLPLSPPARLSILKPLQDAAFSNAAAESHLDEIRFDSERLQGAIATMAHAEVLVAREAVTADDIAFWERELDAVGPNYEQRRIAAIFALTTAGAISKFVGAKDHQGKPKKIDLAVVSSEGRTLYLNKLLSLWDKLSTAFGSEAELLDRLQLSGETILPILDPTLSNAERLFAALYHPPIQHLQQHAEIQLLARFRPRSKELRTLITRLLLPTEEERSFKSGRDLEYWGTLVAAEVYAEQYSDDIELRAQLIDRATAGDTWTPIYAALAELLLIHPDVETAKLLRERSRGLRLDIATFFKICSAVGHSDALIEALLEHALDPSKVEDVAHHAPRWLPAILRRIGQDQTTRAVFITSLRETNQPTRLCSQFSLLRSAAGDANELRDLARQKLLHFSGEPAPVVGFDVTSGLHIPLLPLLNEITSS
ncbi:NACHT domain-containing protein [Hyphomicrobium sp.]|uniref:NACHT domain-containing protein n=1 Tax=Hyphomicrobium sp. TaxID=82 RepID=UPI002D798F45|nr:NACHT domain-containing protein [Hyphomicrobium sp.]HET6388225.1 NACHT domain-containing protein [Hyphomicrobium sp.]